MNVTCMTLAHQPSHNLAFHLIDKAVDFEVEQIERQIRSYTRPDDWPEAAKYYFAMLFERLAARLEEGFSTDRPAT